WPRARSWPFAGPNGPSTTGCARPGQFLITRWPSRCSAFSPTMWPKGCKPSKTSGSRHFPRPSRSRPEVRRMPPKTHRTAVVAMAPAEVWEPLQAIRPQTDRHVQPRMAPITLLYPFMPREQWGEALPALTEAGRHIAPFQVTLTTFRSFTHAFGKATIWLEPEPRHALVTLQAALQAAFPAYDEQSRFAAGFTPHLSVGQAASPAARQHMLSTLQAAWRPVQFTLAAIMLIWREAEGPFEVAHAIPLNRHEALLT